MNPPLIDTHCHLDSSGYQHDLDEIVERALESGVQKMLTLGVSLESSKAAILIANRYPCVWAAVGVHPNYVQEAGAGDWEKIEELARHPRVVAIGETGLDKYWDSAPLDLQREYFQKHIRLSRSVRKPFAVHCREAESEVLEVLQSAAAEGPLSGVMHSFCGSRATAEVCLAAGLHISFAGMLTYKKNEELRRTAAAVPNDRLLVETDAPYLAPVPHRGRRNEPAWVRMTAECLAGVLSMPADELAKHTTENAEKLFWGQ